MNLHMLFPSNGDIEANISYKTIPNEKTSIYNLTLINFPSDYFKKTKEIILATFFSIYFKIIITFVKKNTTIAFNLIFI